MKVKCEWCETESDSEADGDVQVGYCPKCQTRTWHYQSERFEEFRKMPSDQLAQSLNPESADL